MRESGLLPMFMLNPAEHHHEANLFERAEEEDQTPPTNRASLASPTNAITADTSSESSSASVTATTSHPDYNSMIYEEGSFF